VRILPKPRPALAAGSLPARLVEGMSLQPSEEKLLTELLWFASERRRVFANDVFHGVWLPRGGL